jgi:HPt (histidine-containing phosphotransfer) domain-containing protein
MAVTTSPYEADPDSGLAVLDETHLRRMTLGNRRLENEILEIFTHQTTIMLGRMSSADIDLVAAAAHTLLGSARGIGAWRVARSAERLQDAAGKGNGPDLDLALEDLRAAALEARAAIGARQRPIAATRSRKHRA